MRYFLAIVQSASVTTAVIARRYKAATNVKITFALSACLWRDAVDAVIDCAHCVRKKSVLAAIAHSVRDALRSAMFAHACCATLAEIWSAVRKITTIVVRGVWT